MEYPEPYHSTLRHLWRGLERDREKNPNQVPRPFDVFDEPEPKQKFNATFQRLFPERAKSGWPKDLKRPTFEELRETCRKFGNAEDLYGTPPVPPDRP
jgi:hypothetical protein